MTRSAPHNDRPDHREPAYRGLAEAARKFFGQGRNGRPTHPATLTRWILGGVRLSDGRLLKLDAKRLPGRWVVSDDAVQEFIDALTRDRTGAAKAPPPRTSYARRKEAERADRVLTEAGIR